MNVPDGQKQKLIFEKNIANQYQICCPIFIKLSYICQMFICMQYSFLVLRVNIFGFNIKVVPNDPLSMKITSIDNFC